MRRFRFLTFLTLALLIAFGGTALAENPPAGEQAAGAKPEASKQADTDKDPLTKFTRELLVVSGEIKVAGSPAMQPLIEKLAQAFMTQNPQVKIEVKASSSAEGLRAVIDGSANVAMIPRLLTADELKDHAELKSFSIASSGLAFVVHPDNPVKTLAMKQIKDIFLGKITKWKQVGGADKAITVIAVDPASDLFINFNDAALQDPKAKLPKTAMLKSSEMEARSTVATTQDAIGFVSLKALDSSVKAVGLGEAGINIEPSLANIINGTYTVTYPLNMVTKDIPSDVTRTWLLYILGPFGQEIVEKEGYVLSD